MKMPHTLAILGPGILVAATGVGAGDLATASFAGGHLGVAILWAVVLGAALKLLLTEGLARWQLATGTTFLEGCITHFGRPFQVFFLVFLLYWSVYVGSALMAACGIAANAVFPVFDDPDAGKFWFGAAHSLAGLLLIWRGGFKLFERVMSICIVLMFVTVLYTACRLATDLPAILQGLFLPAIPPAGGSGPGWTLALIGGVGGTLTILCYGYWLEETGRNTAGDMRTMRIDLTVAYGLTALFGIAMVIIGSEALTTEGSGASLVIDLTDKLRETAGPAAAAIFLAGAWGAFFSSLLGVWQSIPYLFADFHARSRHGANFTAPELTRTPAYKGYLIALALVPLLVLPFEFKALAKYYSLLGAAFMPFLAAALLYLNNRPLAKAGPHAYRWPTNLALAITILFFLGVGAMQVKARFGG